MLATTVNASNDDLKQLLKNVVEDRQATVGIAVIMNNVDTITINNNEHYPLMSVVKLHQALHVAHWLQQRHLDINHKILVEKQDLKPDTYSPLRDKYPDGNFMISIGDLLKYTLQLSDNNACDIIFRLIGGPANTDNFIRGLGIKDFAIVATEDDMHRQPKLCHDNYTTPLEAALLINRLFNSDTLVNSNLQYIRQTLLECQTGQQRIAQGINPAITTLAHKTGTSDLDGNGRWIGINDVAHIMLADGRNYSLAVFIKDSKEDFATNEHIIAQISAIVFDFLTSCQNQ